MTAHMDLDLSSFMAGFLACVSLVLFYLMFSACQSTEHYPRVTNPYLGRMGQQSSVKACNSGGEGCKLENSNTSMSRVNPFLRR